MVTEATGTLLIEEADENGNILSPSSAQLSDALDSLTVSYTYDLFNRLISTKTGKKTVSFDYEADGYRHSKNTVTPSSEENIVYFYEGDHVAFESDETGKVTAVNHYGTSQYARTIYEGEEETTFYYQFNAYGDVTALIGTDGNTIAKYEYDAFGNLTSQPDIKVNNSITYRGYEYDSETGLYYLNARYYDSETARFLTEDTYRGEKNDPLSLNLYTYCKNNPLKYTDPTGHSAVDFGYVSGSYELSERAKEAQKKRIESLCEDILHIVGGTSVFIFGFTVACAAGTIATPVIAFATLCCAGGTMLYGSSDITEGIDGVLQFIGGDENPDGYSPIKDTIYGGDEESYVNSEMFFVYASDGLLRYGDSAWNWLKNTTRDYYYKIKKAISNAFNIEIGNSTNPNPLANIKYTEKVQRQMNSGDYHSFPDEVTSYGELAKAEKIKGGDGVFRMKYEIPGWYDGKEGVFQFIIEPDGITCNHRLFIPNR